MLDLLGPPEKARQIQDAMIASAPETDGLATKLIDPHQTDSSEIIRLVSATNSAGDLAVHQMARARDEADFVLRGEVIEAHGGQGVSANRDETLRVVWRLTSVKDSRSLGGDVVAAGSETASSNQAGPEQGEDSTQDWTSQLDQLAKENRGESSEESAIELPNLNQAVQRSFELIIPHLKLSEISLLEPRWFRPWSSHSVKLKQANQLAFNGRWPDAQAIWEDVLQSNPRSVAAHHNLAIAAVARQDFEAANRIIRELASWKDNKIITETMAWIEMRHKEYVEAFDLPEPKSGWRITRPSHLAPEDGAKF